MNQATIGQHASEISSAVDTAVSSVKVGQKCGLGEIGSFPIAGGKIVTLNSDLPDPGAVCSLLQVIEQDHLFIRDRIADRYVSPLDRGFLIDEIPAECHGFTSP